MTKTTLKSHSEWRKLAKKARRKRLRQRFASLRALEAEKERNQREASPSYHLWKEEQKKIEEFQEREEKRIKDEEERLYLERERLAQEHWKDLQEKLKLSKLEREKQILRIKEEWDREQKKLKELKEKKEKVEEEKRLQQEQLQERIEEFVNSNGDMPQELHQDLHSNPSKETCPFFKKTAACRFNDSCSRNHIRPTVSRTLIIRNFYSHYSLEQTSENEHGSDSILEFETRETYHHFKEFFNDVIPELEKFGVVRQFKACCNRESHLRGNVYIEFAHCREAVKCFRGLQGRWYGGKQINVEFCKIDSWKSAICGLFYRRKCPKGSVCNFLHVFHNPGNLFLNADRDLHRTPPTTDFDSESSRNWRWSESPERIERNVEDSERSQGRSRRSHDETSKGKSRDERGSSRRERSRRRSRSRSRRRSKSKHRKKRRKSRES